MTMHDKALAFIRTYVPYLIGLAVVWVLVHADVVIPDDVHGAFVALAIGVVTVLYYVIVRLVETRLPWLGVLLGWPSRPDYPDVANLWASFVRTLIPAVGSAIVVFLAALLSSAAGAAIDLDTQAQLAIVTVGILETGYYAAAKWITSHWPAASWLLGSAPAPVYAPALTDTKG
jgi:hypothetical protein